MRSHMAQSCPWVGLTHGLGWVEFFSIFHGLDRWVGSNVEFPKIPSRSICSGTVCRHPQTSQQAVQRDSRAEMSSQCIKQCACQLLTMDLFISGSNNKGTTRYCLTLLAVYSAFRRAQLNLSVTSQLGTLQQMSVLDSAAIRSNQLNWFDGECGQAVPWQCQVAR
jgi:hypothetical protein